MPSELIDKKPKAGGEFLNSRGIIVGNSGCIFCCSGITVKSKDMPKYNPAALDPETPDVHILVANVTGEKAANRIFEMFVKFNLSDGFYYDPENNQVRIGACKEHYRNLDGLIPNNGIIDMVKIIEAMSTH